MIYGVLKYTIHVEVVYVVSEHGILRGTKLEPIPLYEPDESDHWDHANGPDRSSNGRKAAPPEEYPDSQGMQFPTPHPRHKP